MSYECDWKNPTCVEKHFRHSAPLLIHGRCIWWAQSGVAVQCHRCLDWMELLLLFRTQQRKVLRSRVKSCISPPYNIYCFPHGKKLFCSCSRRPSENGCILKGKWFSLMNKADSRLTQPSFQFAISMDLTKLPLSRITVNYLMAEFFFFFFLVDGIADWGDGEVALSERYLLHKQANPNVILSTCLRKPGMVIHSCNLNAEEAETGRSRSPLTRQPCLIHKPQVPGSGLVSDRTKHWTEERSNAL